MAGNEERHRAIAGTSLVILGVVSVLGIVVAEALYPGYSTSRQTISALGAASDSGGTVQPSASIFNGAMVVSGLFALVAADRFRRLDGHRLLTVVVGLTGLGVVGVGVFPAQYGLVHGVAALVAFGGGGLSALVAATVVIGPFRYLSASLGVVAIVALALFVTLGGATALGIGGLERLVSYPIQIWTVAFGGYLLGGVRAGESPT